MAINLELVNNLTKTIVNSKLELSELPDSLSQCLMKLPDNVIEKFSNDLNAILRWQSKINMVGDTLNILLEIDSKNCFTDSTGTAHFIFRIMKYDRRNKEAFTIYLPKLSNVSVISMKRSVMGQLRQEFFYRPNKIDNGISIDLSSLRFTSMDKEMDIAASRTASVISSILTYLYASNLRTFSNNVIINNRQLASDVRRLFFLEKDQRVEAFGDSSIFTFADTLSNLIHIHLMSKVVEKISGIGKDKFSLITEEYDEYCKDQMEGFKFAGHDIQEYMRYLVKRGAYAGQDKATIGCMLYNEYTRFLDDELILDVQQSIDIDNNKCLKFTYTEFFEHRCRVIY